MLVGVLSLEYNKMEEAWVLIFLAVAMLLGCYLAGLIPLVVSLSEEKLQIVSVVGAGLLVGTALAVIIPEGVHTLYSAEMEKSEHHEHAVEPASLPEGEGAQQTLSIVKPHNHLEMHSVIGISLVLGFVFMLIVDQIGGAHSKSQDTESGTVPKDRSKFTATLGLVVHAAADGIALGAAATTSRTDVEMIVFFAIMLHKAPAAFGLVSFLLHAGLDRTKIRKHLLVFALSAPVLAIVTYFGISQSGKETLSSVNATGIAMLFSAGTFLYVATVHVLPEIVANGSETRSFRKVELLALITGALLPLLLSVGHHH